MAIDPNMLVRPGEIITSTFMNDLLSSIDDLKNRVARLEGAGPVGGSQVSITRFDPETQVAVGQPLIIHGRNFDSVTSNNRITIGGRPVTEFRTGSTSDELRFIVPDIEDVPPGGKNVSVIVANDNGRDERLYRVVPKIPVTGTPPQITGITHQATGSTTLRVNQQAVIAGSNFDAVPGNNRIKFTVVSNGRAYPDPVTNLPVIAIDAANSNSSSIRLTVPDIEEVLAAAGSTVVDIEVGVGAHVPAIRRVSIVRV